MTNHTGHYMGTEINKNSLLLSSGFLLSKKREDIEKMIEKIKMMREASLAAENEPPKYGAVDGLVYQ